MNLKDYLTKLQCSLVAQVIRIALADCQDYNLQSRGGREEVAKKICRELGL